MSKKKRIGKKIDAIEIRMVTLKRRVVCHVTCREILFEKGHRAKHDDEANVPDRAFYLLSKNLLSLSGYMIVDNEQRNDLIRIAVDNANALGLDLSFDGFIELVVLDGRIAFELT